MVLPPIAHRLQSRCQPELQLSEGWTAAGRTYFLVAQSHSQQAGAASPCRPLWAAWVSSGRGGCLSTVNSSRKQAQAAEPQASYFVNPTMCYWRRKQQPTPVILPGEFHGQRSLAGTVCGVAESQAWLSNSHYHSLTMFYSLEIFFIRGTMNRSDSFAQNRKWILGNSSTLLIKASSING